MRACGISEGFIIIIYARARDILRSSWGALAARETAKAFFKMPLLLARGCPSEGVREGKRDRISEWLGEDFVKKSAKISVLNGEKGEFFINELEFFAFFKQVKITQGTFCT